LAANGVPLRRNTGLERIVSCLKSTIGAMGMCAA